MAAEAVGKPQRNLQRKFWQAPPSEASCDLLLSLGTLLIVTGAVSAIAPLSFSLPVGPFLGTILIVAGAIVLTENFCLTDTTRILGNLFLGGIYLVAGISTLPALAEGVPAPHAIIATFFLLASLTKGSVALISRKRNPNWGYMLLSSLMTLALALVLFSGWPGSSTWSLGLVVGIDLIFTGLCAVTLATFKIEFA